MNSLGWFERLFPVAMILIPLLTSLGQPSQYATDQQRQRHASIRRLLALATVACLAIVVLMWRLAPDIAMFSWMLIFLLSPISMRLINLRNPEVAEAWQRQQRSASLAPRSAILARGPWLLHTAAWVAWLVMLALTAVGLAQQHWQNFWIVAFHGFALFWLIWSRLFSMRTVHEGEPLPQHPGPEILRMYERFRSGRQLVWIVVGVAAMLAFAAPPTILSWYPENGLQAAIWIGAGGGVLGGVFGGLAGAWADRQRIALARMVLAQENKSRDS